MKNKSTFGLIYTFRKKMPLASKQELKDVVKTHLIECINKTPKSYRQKIANYNRQIFELNKLIIC